ncbi:RILP-like protein 2 isoform X2 [Sinocyclocheilus rhinocerous]|uniref:RILP-like protein 2 isoform X2 n=1 Tax=Sinocyclocheilus rhinocerous TaxID=307959 RepID=UPI0007BA406E|nr:PREDICTED: RILP-like protein 2 isoform X2 [Sinocyclocheilus rhinocerous]
MHWDGELELAISWKDSSFLFFYSDCIVRLGIRMEGRHDSSPMQAFDKDVLEMTCEDVYDISYVIGRDLLKVNTGSREFSDLQFKIVRVLEMFETMVNKYNLSLEELRMELENMKREMERVVAEGSSGNVNTTVGPNKLVVDLKDPNRPRFTMQELKEVLQERNKLKAQLLVAQEELQLYKSGVLGSEKKMVEVNLETLPQSEAAPSSVIEENKEKSTIQKLFSFRQK